MTELTYSDGIREGLSIGLLLGGAATTVFVVLWFRLKRRLRGLANNPDNIFAILVERGWQLKHDEYAEGIKWVVGGERDTNIAVAWAKANGAWLGRKSAEEDVQ